MNSCLIRANRPRFWGDVVPLVEMGPGCRVGPGPFCPLSAIGYPPFVLRSGRVDHYSVVMTTIVDERIDERIAERLRRERAARNWSLADLAERSGVSKAMISKIERCEASPTAALLGRLSGAFGQTLSSLLISVEDQSGRFSPKDTQPQWRDAETGFVRRSLTPQGSAATELVHGTLPPGARIEYPADAYRFIDQQIVGLSGTLTFIEGEVEHTIREGDCLVLGLPARCTYENRGRRACTYLVVVSRRA